MTLSEMEPLRQLEEKNNRPKEMVADLTLDKELGGLLINCRSELKTL